MDPQTPPTQQPTPQQPYQGLPTMPQPISQQTQYVPQAPTAYANSTDGSTQEYSIDYLERIAPKEQKTVNKFAVFGLIGAVIISAVFALIVIVNPGGTGTNTLLPSIAARVSTLQDVVKEQQPRLTGSDLSSANAALGSALSTMNTDLTAAIKERKLKKPSKTTITKEAAYKSSLSTKLEGAHQKGMLDRTYLSQMTYELTVLKSQLAKLKRSTTSKSLKTLCDSAITNIETILTSYQASDVSKS